VSVYLLLLASVLTVVTVLGWLEVWLRPAPRRTFASDWRWLTVLVLFSPLTLVIWGQWLAGPRSGTGRGLASVCWVLLAANVVPAYFIYRPVSRTLRRARRFLKEGDLDRAAAAYQRILDSGRRGERPRAALGLGFVLMRRGDLDDARVALQQAIDSGRPNVAAMAAFDLGCLLEEQGDIEGARAAYQRAVHRGPSDARDRAVRALLMLDAPPDGG